MYGDRRALVHVATTVTQLYEQPFTKTVIHNFMRFVVSFPVTKRDK